MKLHPALLAVSALLVSGGLAACEGGSASQGAPGSAGTESSVPLDAEIDRDGVFSWGYTIEATSLDPHRGSSGFDQNWLYPVYDRLVYSAPDGQLKPMLATDWKVSPDGRSIEMNLRANLEFSDGSPFDAVAAKFSLDRARDDQSTVRTEMSGVTGVEVVDVDTLRIELDGGAGSFLGALADRAGMMVSPKAAEADTLNQNPVGIGAYRVTEVSPGDKVVYERTEGYWDPEAQNVKSMVFKVMSDDQTRLNAMQSGELTMALIRQNQVEPSIGMGLEVLSGESPTFYNFSMNTNKAPFDDPRVRAAVSMSIDREAIGDGLLEGYCTPQLQPWPSISFAYSEKVGNGLDQVPHDVEQARDLLAEAGRPDGFEFDAVVTNITGYTAVAEAVQAQLKKAGITMNLQVVPSAQASDMFTEQEVGATVSGYSPSPDPQGVMDRLILPDAPNNPGGYTDDVIVDLAEQAANAVDPAERAGFYEKISERMLEVTPSAVPVCMQKRTEAYSSTVSGLDIYASGARDYRGVGIAPE